MGDKQVLIQVHILLLREYIKIRIYDGFGTELVIIVIKKFHTKIPKMTITEHKMTDLGLS